jgi:hypothetical protein
VYHFPIFGDCNVATIRRRGAGPEVVWVFDGAVNYTICPTQELAEAAADAVPLVTLYRCGQREKPERVRRCLEALAQSGQELLASPLVRHLTHYAEHLERGTDWTNGNEQSA